MCPVCLTSLAVTLAATAGGGGGITAIALRIRRSLGKDREPEPRKDRAHEPVETRRHP
jgi:hypothetical protein